MVAKAAPFTPIRSRNINIGSKSILIIIPVAFIFRVSLLFPKLPNILEYKKLKKEKKYENLPENLKELANLRIQNPEASYQELGAMLKEPIGKSGVSHRLEKIVKIAEE